MSTLNDLIMSAVSAPYAKYPALPTHRYSTVMEVKEFRSTGLNFSGSAMEERSGSIIATPSNAKVATPKKSA